MDRAVGCLLGGALGDALGAPVEFLSRSAILAKYGPWGIQHLDKAYGRVGAITDDTQMTLFTAEGLIRANVRGTLKGICHPPTMVAYSYQRWLHTQGEQVMPYAIEPELQGWLLTERDLFSRRAPGNTCLSALRGWREVTLEAKNNSKGCGTVMRSAPFGFFESPWELSAACSQITHGHPQATVSAGAFAHMISELAQGLSLDDAFQSTIDQCDFEAPMVNLLLDARRYRDEKIDPVGAVALLGEGWVAEEALAIGVFCALCHPNDFRSAVQLAVNHSGDSDSTGAICGNLLGALHGAQCLPEDWLTQLELREVIEQVAIDLVNPLPVSTHYDSQESERAGSAFWDRYPGA